MTNPLEAAGFVPVSNDYSSPEVIARIRKALIDNRYDDDGPHCQSYTLPWWVWDSIFHNLPSDLGHILYTEDSPLADVNHLIEGDQSINMITLVERRDAVNEVLALRKRKWIMQKNS